MTKILKTKIKSWQEYLNLENYIYEKLSIVDRDILLNCINFRINKANIILLEDITQYYFDVTLLQETKNALTLNRLAIKLKDYKIL